MACIFLVVYLLGLVMGIALIVMICGLFVTGAIVFMALLMIFLAWYIGQGNNTESHCIGINQ